MKFSLNFVLENKKERKPRKMNVLEETYDVAVVGAGHAG